MKDMNKLIFSIIFFILTVTFYTLYADNPSDPPCKDCGSISNCLVGSGVTGWPHCWIVYDDYGIHCGVTGEYGACNPGV